MASPAREVIAQAMYGRFGLYDIRIWKEHADAIIAALEGAGLVIVSEEVSWEMRKAYWDAHDKGQLVPNPETIWQAMLRAHSGDADDR